MPLVSVFGDNNSHGGGALQASNNSGHFFVNGKKTVYKESLAEPDNAGHPPAATTSKTASSKFYSEGIQVHRHGDLRYCDASTIVTGQTRFYCGG